jgi:hypothetical protein
MKRLISAMVIAGVCATGAAFAQTAPQGHPATYAAKKAGKKPAKTYTCKDGTVHTGKHPKKGCKAHGGVKKS